MRPGFIGLVAAVHLSFTTPASCQEPQPPLSSALKFFAAFASRDVHSTLRALRGVPISLPERERIRATLPPEGTLSPTPNEIKKIDALKTVLIYHERDHVFDIKVIDLPQAYIGLHGRAILLISRPALKVLTASELQALSAHELGHDFLWIQFENGRHGRSRQELELECDGIAALTLVALRLDVMSLLTATRTMDHFNKQFGTPSNVADYPPPEHRQQLIETLVRVREIKRHSTINQPSRTVIQQFQ